jgi:hypothetical protein
LDSLGHADVRPVAPRFGALCEIGWRMTVGLGAGALAGFVIGGGVGRLFMFVLRLTSPDVLMGLESDDGFVIGQFTAVDTLTLMLLTATLGGFAGVGYAAIRPILPRRIRVAAWTLLAATAGGATIVHTDGVDFALLRPLWLAADGIILVLALGSFVTALLVEQWSVLEPGPRARSTWGIGALGLLGAPAILGAVIATLALTALSEIAGHLSPNARLAAVRAITVIAMVAMGVMMVLGVIDLARDISKLS